MASSGARPVPLASANHSRIGIIDIGSNSVRLVVFDGLRRTPIPVYNEKVLCGLGRGLRASGRLNAEGVQRSIPHLQRFVALAGSVGVDRLDAVATAAVRDASDGAAFVAEVEQTCQIKVEVLSGEEEARLAALGVLSGIPGADGIMGDLGGGSLELVEVGPAGFGPWATLPLGPLNLMSSQAENGKDPGDVMKDAIAGLDWLELGAGKDFYPVGGAWRSLARIHMAQTRYPLHVIDHYTVARDEMDDLLSVVMRQAPKSLGVVPGITRGRLETLPIAARVMRRVLRTIRPRRVVFSAQGLREGLLYSGLSDAVREEDPLLSACRDLAQGLSRFDVIGEEVMSWTSPLFAREDPAGRRLREAACLIADIGWSEHPDYRSEHAFFKAFRLPGVGVDHPGRAFLALVLAARYGGRVRPKAIRAARGLLGEEASHRAEVLGLALRLAINLSGGSRGVLTRTQLALDGDTISLILSPGAAVYSGEVVQRRLESLADLLGRKAQIVDQDNTPASVQ
ncbi:MAG: Ppx/GppA family phosphatase [Alphaproteobacteria bacterium]|nr:Ppx/GppA family phosphatase [Alphaproteobacteria bacterium]